MRGLRMLDYPTDAEMLAMWQQGKDTLDIANRFFVQESWVAEQIPRILLRDRQDKEWQRGAA